MEEKQPKSWWQTVPSILTGLAGVITATTGLIIALQQVRILNKADVDDLNKSVSPTPASPTPASPPKLSKITYRGTKGTYTVDYNKGTYYGCVDNLGCIFLGANKRVDNSSWKNGSYLYEVSPTKVIVYKNGSVIYRDTFN